MPDGSSPSLTPASAAAQTEDGKDARGPEEDRREGKGEEKGDVKQKGPEEAQGDRERLAATLIQKHYRGHRSRVEFESHRLDSSTRWNEAVQSLRTARYQRAQISVSPEDHTPRARLQRAAHLAAHLQDGEGLRGATGGRAVGRGEGAATVGETAIRRAEREKGPGGDEGLARAWRAVGEKKKEMDLRMQGRLDSDKKVPPALKERQSKQLHGEHWLEMVDSKHRYGSNLKYYHARWKESDTKDTFFRWLDHGEGRSLDLPECPREQLDKEKIFYCSAEQRLNYLVLPDPSTGLLYWARSGQPVDTTPGRWKDAGNGQGIVALEDGEESGYDDEAGRSDSDSDSSFSCSSSLSSVESAQGHHYLAPESEKQNQGPVGKVRVRFTTRGMMDRLLRKTVRKNTWIYVSDMSYNVFVGIKSTGAFQHSSFLAGGLVSSAGLIRAREGRIRALSPLSGHYRSSINHFKVFLNEMERQGVDLSKVKVGKSEMMLWGLEKYAELSKKKDAKKESSKANIHHVLEKLHLVAPTPSSDSRSESEEHAAAAEKENSQEQREGKEASAEEEATRRGGILEFLGIGTGGPGKGVGENTH